MTLFKYTALALAASSASAFINRARHAPLSGSTWRSNVAVKGVLSDLYDNKDLDKAMEGEIEYKPGGADSDFARKFGHLVGKEVQSVDERFAEFTRILGHPINALYRNTITDMVAVIHLDVVCATFQRDPIWCLGAVGTMDLLLKNYPDKDIGEDIAKAFFESMGMTVKEIEEEAKIITDWCQGKSPEDALAALRGEGDSPVAAIAKKIKDDGEDFWEYTTFFGVGLLKIMEGVGIDVKRENIWPLSEEWAQDALGIDMLGPYFDCNNYLKDKRRLDVMETMMKEIEIREKKRMAQRLEEKAELALEQAEREARWKKEQEEAEKARLARIEAKADAKAEEEKKVDA